MNGGDKQKKERVERLTQLGLKGEPSKGDANCVHCGLPFFTHQSTGGHVGVCQGCIDD